MFHKAVAVQQESRPLQRSTSCVTRVDAKPNTLTGFTSSSARASLSTSQPLPREGQMMSRPLHADALKPSPPAILNRATPESMTGIGIIPVAKWNAGQSTIPSASGAFNRENHINKATPPSIPIVASQENSVHSAVFFREEDFDDEVDLDFEVEDPRTKGSVSQQSQGASTSVTIEAVTNQAAAPEEVPPNSSHPLPWSSSPVHHKHGVPPRGIPSTHHPPPVGPVSESQVDSVDEADPPHKKRRTLFWGSQHASVEQNANPSGQAMQMAVGRGHSQDANGARVGASNVKTEAKVQPWEQTPSAVKESQKRLKQERKRVTSSLGSREASVDNSLLRKPKRMERVFLSDEQKWVEKLVVTEGRSVFFTGSAGTGKSVLLRELIRGLRIKFANEPDRVAVTASTGLAACNVGGVTLHSFSGIGLGKEPAKDLVKKIRKNPKAKTRWERTKVLIIDEVSMVDGDMFDKLEEIARTIRKKPRPFGGIQLVITGDFFQLPPVPDSGKLAKFAFEAATWPTTIAETIGLTQIFRQKDPVFAGMLNEMRLGRLTPTSIATFSKLSRPIKYEDGLDATELFSTRAEVDGANHTRLRLLEGEAVTFEARDGGTITDKPQRDRLLANCMAPANIQLKKGAQVMLIKNLDESLVNGSLGKVLGFMDEVEFEIFSRHETEYELLDGMVPESEEVNKARAKSRIKQDSDAPRLPGRRWPYVRFTNADGTSRSILCQPEVWKVELPNGEVQASRAQVPLILAWALSIHKAQGQTLERVKVDLGRIFEKGQAYVALSRATSQEGLQVLRFDARKVMAHDRVRQFYDGLYSEGGSAGVQMQTTKTTPAMFSNTSKSTKPVKSESVAPPRTGSIVTPLQQIFDDDDDEENYHAAAHG